MTRNDGLAVGSTMIEKVKKNMSTSELRAWNKLENETSRMWRNFWIVVSKRHGYTNAEIAKEFGVSESTVRALR